MPHLLSMLLLPLLPLLPLLLLPPLLLLLLQDGDGRRPAAKLSDG